MSEPLSLESQVAVTYEVVTRMERRLFGAEGNNGLIGRMQTETEAQEKRLDTLESGLGDCPVLNGGNAGCPPKGRAKLPANGTFMAGMVIGAGAMFQLVAWMGKAAWERLPEWLAALKH